MPAIQTRPPRVGGLIKKEFWTEEAWCRDVISITMALVDFKVGTVVTDDNQDGTYTVIPLDTTALLAGDPVAIVIDPDYLEKIAAAVAAASATVDLIVLVGGPSVIASGLLSFAGTAGYGTPADFDGNVAVAQASLQTQGIKFEATYSSSQASS